MPLVRWNVHRHVVCAKVQAACFFQTTCASRAPRFFTIDGGWRWANETSDIDKSKLDCLFRACGEKKRHYSKGVVSVFSLANLSLPLHISFCFGFSRLPPFQAATTPSPKQHRAANTCDTTSETLIRSCCPEANVQEKRTAAQILPEQADACCARWELGNSQLNTNCSDSSHR